MRCQYLIPVVWIMAMVGFTVQSGKEFSPEKQRLRSKRKRVSMPLLSEYVDEFLNSNPSIKAHLVHISDAKLLYWATQLASKIEERYTLYPSTLINRFSHHISDIVYILKLCRKQAQDHLLEDPVFWNEEEYSKKTLRELLKLNQDHQKECTEKMKSIEGMLVGATKGDVKESQNLEKELVEMVGALNKNHQWMFQAFVGFPQVAARKKLNDQWSFLRKQGHFLQNYGPILLQHVQSLCRLNEFMHDKIKAIFSDAHLGITPYTNKVMGLKWEMMHKAIDELADIHSNMSEKDRMILDQWCKKTATLLWKEWLKDLQNKSQHPSCDKGRLLVHQKLIANQLVQLLTKPIQGLDQFKALLSPHHSGLILSKNLLDQACDYILDLLEKAQGMKPNPKDGSDLEKAQSETKKST